MNDAAQQDNGWEASAAAWLNLMEQGDVNRVLLLDEVMLGLCGEVCGLDVLDVGCGEGRFCRMLAERGARTTGIDPTPTLLTVARTKQPEGIFHEAQAEALPLAEASMDLVVSYVSLVDIPDCRAAIREMSRVLRPGGRCVIANQNSFATATSHGWVRDAAGLKQHWAFDNYMTERAECAQWAGISIINWHRPLSAYLQAFLAAGLRLEHFDEPLPSPTALKLRPGMDDYWRMPHFCTMVWRK